MAFDPPARILVIDDDDAIRRLIVKYLKKNVIAQYLVENKQKIIKNRPFYLLSSPNYVINNIWNPILFIKAIS